MKDAVITVRIPTPTRRRIEALARREGRSLSQQVERLIERGMAGDAPAYGVARPGGARSLSGSLRGGHVPLLDEFREVRGVLSAALGRQSRAIADRSR
jgi:hypothetical protein